MARGLRYAGRLLEAGLWAVGLVCGVRLYNRHRAERRRRSSEATVICERCGDVQRVEDFLDPTTTCTCVTSGCRDSPR